MRVATKSDTSSLFQTPLVEKKEGPGRGLKTTYKQKDLIISWLQERKNFLWITGGLSCKLQKHYSLK